eukprot:2557209-Prymnesium_polylepis.6
MGLLIGGTMGGCGGGWEQRLAEPQSEQSVVRLQLLYSLPGPPSSQSPSDEWLHVSEQHGDEQRMPQSEQSVPRLQ